MVCCTMMTYWIPLHQETTDTHKSPKGREAQGIAPLDKYLEDSRKRSREGKVAFRHHLDPHVVIKENTIRRDIRK